MRARLSLLVVGLALLSASLPAQAAGHGELHLVPEWPTSFQEAREEPIRLLPGPPIEEHQRGPLVPGSSTADTEHAFRWTLENPNGTTGPYGDLALDPGEPVVVDVYLSADAAPEPAPKPAPADDTGIAPNLTVEVEVTVAGTTIGPAEETRTLVSSPAHEDVTRYRFSFDHGLPVLPAGAGLSADVSIQQAERAGETLTLPTWNVHVSPEHPTGLSLGLDEDAEPDEALQPQTTSTSRETQDVRTTAVATLAGSLMAALLAGGRMVSQLVRD